MSRRIRSILLVCNSYDGFSLEEEGRIDLQIRQEYTELSLSNPPEIFRVETTVEALALLEEGRRFDLVITMYNVGQMSVFEFAGRAKSIDPAMPVVLLCSYSREIYDKIDECGCPDIDMVFCWNSSADLIIAIIKLLEDRMNADNDILGDGVQGILLVEDSIRYYSTYLPALYKLVLQQNKESVTDTLNETQMLLRKRSRPKILMATNYEDAVALFEKYKNNLLGVISDVGFVLKKGDKHSEEKIDAGVDLCRRVKADSPKMPFLMQSSQESMRETAASLGVGFLKKTSSVLIQELGEYIEREFGFGDFVVVDQRSGKEIARAGDLREFEELIGSIPVESFRYICENNKLSKWLYARGIFELGRKFSPRRLEEDADIEVHRSKTVDLIHDFRVQSALGVVAAFSPETYNDTIWFSRLGSGALGGKARGLAFLNHILQKHKLYNEWEGVHVCVPRTLVITADWFDRFIKENGLKYVIGTDLSDSELLAEFVASPLPVELSKALRVFLREVHGPLAIRSSSKLEDSYHQPFAGVYSTYMIPDAPDEDQRLRMLTKAITSVYASTYFASARSYIISSGNVLSEEKMAVVIEQVCGRDENGVFLPAISGVARSVNFYPVGPEKAEDGIVKIAYGLGKAVVDGDQVLRFSPKYPRNVLQTSTPDQVMRETQTGVYALDMRPEKFKASVNDSVNLLRLPVSECSGFSSFGRVVSTWDRENMRIVDSAFPEGPKYITFAPVLKYGSFPLASIISRLLDICKAELKTEVEIEFAVNCEEGQVVEFSVLQVRPISSDTRAAEVDWNAIDKSGALLESDCALGTGFIEGVRDIVYLRREGWNVLKTHQIAEEIKSLNAEMLKSKRGYLLLGFGRWGTSEPTLGVPLPWSSISEAKAIVECALPDFQIDPSQGTHFFQNLTSFNVGYVNVNPWKRRGDSLDFSMLDSLPAVYETQFVRHVRLDHDIQIVIDGLENRALVNLNSSL